MLRCLAALAVLAAALAAPAAARAQPPDEAPPAEAEAAEAEAAAPAAADEPDSEPASEPEPRPEVRAVQEGLNALGYDAGPVDGLLGPRTRAAIRAFQADRGVPQTGAVTTALSRRIEAARFRASPEAAALWRRAARYLRALGYAPGEGGFASPAAEAAIAAFQRARGRAPTGAFARGAYEAIAWAAERSPAARRTLCLDLYREGAYERAAAWCRRAAEAGDAEGQLWLGHIHYYGLAGARDYAAAARWYRRAAEQGDSRAQTYLGVMYDKGRGVPRDPAEAQRWFRLATGQEAR